MTFEDSGAEQAEGFVGEIHYEGLEGTVPASLVEAGKRLTAARPLKPEDLQAYLRAVTTLSEWNARTEIVRMPNAVRGAVTMIVHMTPKDGAFAHTSGAAGKESESESSFFASKRKFALIAVGAGVALLLILLAALALLRGPEKDPTSLVYGDWRLTCLAASAAGTECSLVQDVTYEQARKPIMRYTVERKGDKHVFSILVQHDVMLVPGVRVVIDSELRKVPYYICKAEGCISRLSFDDKLEQQLVGAKSGYVSVVSLMGNTQTAKLSAKGFAEGLTAYRDAMRVRGPWWKRMLP